MATVTVLNIGPKPRKTAENRVTDTARIGHPQPGKSAYRDGQGALFGDTDDDRVTEGDRWVTEKKPIGHPRHAVTTSTNTDRVTEVTDISNIYSIGENRAKTGAETHSGDYIGENRSPSVTRIDTPTNQTPTLADLKTLAGTPSSRTIRATTCRQCGAPIITGLDNDYCAVTVHVDWTPLDPLGEVTAILQGRRTYELHQRIGSTPTLTRRNARRITAFPAGASNHGRRSDTVPAHQCNSPPITPIPSLYKPKPKTTNRNQPAPF